MSQEDIEQTTAISPTQATEKPTMPPYSINSFKIQEASSPINVSPFLHPHDHHGTHLEPAHNNNMAEDPSILMSTGVLVDDLMSGELSDGHLLLNAAGMSNSGREPFHSDPTVGSGDLPGSLPNMPIGDLTSFVPTVGQTFSNFHEIETLLDAFARANSFMIIIMRSQRPSGHVVQATFGCYKSGSYRPNKADTPNKRTIKTNCPFQINVRYSEKANEYRITKVDLEHNHELDMSDVKSNIVKKSNKRRSSITGDEGLGLDGGDSVNGSHLKTLKKPRRPRKNKSEQETPGSSTGASADTTPVDTPNLSAEDLAMGLLHNLPNHDDEDDAQNGRDDCLHHLHMSGEEGLSGSANAFDILSGLELPEEIAQEVNAAMQYHMESMANENSEPH